MKKLPIILLSLIAILCFSGCNLTEQQNTQIIKQQKNITEFTIIEGKTTKQEVLDALGNPDQMSAHHYLYDYYSKHYDQLNLHIVKLDNTTFNVV